MKRIRRNHNPRRRRSGTLSGRRTLAGKGLGEINSLSDLCAKTSFLPEGACDCNSISGYLELAGYDPCEYGPYQSFCPNAYREMVEVGRCEGKNPELPPDLAPPQQAGMSTGVKLLLGAAAGGTILSLVMNAGDDS